MFLVAHATPPPLAPQMAAVLAAGGDAVLSHRSAAALWQLSASSGGVIEVTIPGKLRKSRRGIRVHTTQTIEQTKRHAIPVTTPARTLLDLAASEDQRRLERALDEALTQRLTSVSGLERLLERHPRHRGAAKLKALVAGERGTTITRSEAEELLLRLIRAALLPLPEMNARVGRWEVDFLWRTNNVAVEVNGYAFHGRTRRQFERDHAKAAALEALGLTVIPVSYSQLAHEPHATVARLARALR